MNLELTRDEVVGAADFDPHDGDFYDSAEERQLAKKISDYLESTKPASALEPK